MMGMVLTKVYMQMDDLGITKHGVDENGQPYYPCVIIAHHGWTKNFSLMSTNLLPNG
jgi:hypothetical protein